MVPVNTNKGYGTPGSSILTTRCPLRITQTSEVIKGGITDQKYPNKDFRYWPFIFLCVSRRPNA